MLKIKVFDCEDERDLETTINKFIEQIDKEDKEVIDIKYQANCTMYDDEQVYIYSALIMYNDKLYRTPKKYEIVEKIEQC